MKSLVLAAGAVLALLAADPAMAEGPRGGHGDGCGQCGGGHTPPPPPPPCCHGGRNTNINVNVNASASASASASARSYLNARTWSGGSMSRGYAGGGTVYVGGGYGGDIGYLAGPVVYGETALAHGLACAPAPFGYTLHGFGREIGAPARCGRYGYDAAYREDRGGRYGYSEQHESWSEESYREESYREERYADGYGYEEARRDDHDCGCDRDRSPAPYPPAYLPEPPPAYTPPPPPRRHSRSAPRPAPHRSTPRPRQHYAQEPGERG